MDFDFGFDGGNESIFQFGKSTSKKPSRGSGKTTAVKRKRRGLERTFQRQNSGSNHAASTNNSDNNSATRSTPSSSQSSASAKTNGFKTGNTSVSSSSKSFARPKSKQSENESTSTRRRLIRRRQEEEETFEVHENALDDNEESSSGGSGTESAFSSRPVTIVRRKPMSEQVSVRRGAAGFSAYAVQDAGTFQMLHDECTYLCSTILSKTINPAKAIDAAIELATVLSCRKTRSILWQGGESNGGDHNNPQSPSSSSRNTRKSQSIPKIWSSIFDIISMVSLTNNDNLNGTFSSNTSLASSSAAASTRSATDPFPKRSRTKSARRKERELSQGSVGTARQNFKSFQVTPTSSTMTAEMKEVLACIVYYISWDCTLSSDHSIAAMGSFKSPSLARKIRMAVLERGGVLAGIVKLMATSQGGPPVSTTGGSRSIDAPVSPLRTAPSQARKRTLRSSESTATSLPRNFDVPPTVYSNSLSSPKGAKSPPSKKARDPTAMGRRNRKKKRKLKIESPMDDDSPTPPSLVVNMHSIPEQVGDLEENEESKTMPPPTNRLTSHHQTGRTNSLRRAVCEGDKSSFPETSVIESSNDDTSSIVSEATLQLTGRVLQKVDALCANLRMESLESSESGKGAAVGASTDATDPCIVFYNEKKYNGVNGLFPVGDSPWLTMICLESLTRILTGKELNGKTSCLEGDHSSGNQGGGGSYEEGDNEVDEEASNIFLLTNRLVGKSGIIPLLAFAMSESMLAATKLIFPKSHRNPSRTEDTIAQEWHYCHNRLKLLASLIDEACFFSESNRRKFCEDDPFSFVEKKEGLIFHILLFLHECSQCDLSQLDHKRSETMSFALRTLTSLTHDNAIAAEQMKLSNDSHPEGIEILTRLLLQLEGHSQTPKLNKRKRTSLTSKTKATDHDMHRYDGTIFCLTTLANIIESSGVRRMLLGIKVGPGDSTLWLQWLCQWVLQQTETFRQEILSIGSKSNPQNGSTTNASLPGTTQESNEELQKHEEEKLVASGNACVVLACLMTETEDDDVESSICIRKLVKDEMPVDSDGKSSGLALVVNTLKAYCNYYHISMGQMSFAVVAPVKKLIVDLEEIIEFEDYKSEDPDDNHD